MHPIDVMIALSSTVSLSYWGFYLLPLGEHMTEAELAELMSTLLGLGELGGSAETGIYDASNAREFLRKYLSEDITADSFAAQVLGFVTEGGTDASTS